MHFEASRICLLMHSTLLMPPVEIKFEYECEHMLIDWMTVLLQLLFRLIVSSFQFNSLTFISSEWHFKSLTNSFFAICCTQIKTAFYWKENNQFSCIYASFVMVKSVENEIFMRLSLIFNFHTPQFPFPFFDSHTHNC